MRVGILASHTIQYQAPWFRGLAKETDLHVFFAHRQSAVEQGKAGFGVAFDWDVDLLSGYKSSFLQNVARRPGVNHFFGCDTPEIEGIISGKLKSENLKSGNDFSILESQRVRISPFDAFIVNGWALKAYWQAVRACRRNNIPVFVRGDSQLRTPRSRILESAKEIAYRIMLRQFDGFLTVGKRNREYLAHYGVPAKKMFSAPHFVDNERFAFQAESIRSQKSEIRSQWRIPEDAFCVLFCGKFISKKRPIDLIKAAQLLLRSQPELKVHLLFVGSGELGGELRASCDVVFDAASDQKTNNEKPITNNQKPRASFAGFLNQTEISKAYVAADVLVLPSDGRETWGLVVNEAMACGSPAIVSDAVGCAPDLIEEGTTGFTFAFGDCEQMAYRLKSLADLKEHGRDFRPDLTSKLQDYSVEAAVRGTLGATRALVRHRAEKL